MKANSTDLTIRWGKRRSGLRFRTLSMAAATILAMTVASGCGSSDSESSDAASAASVDEASAAASEEASAEASEAEEASAEEPDDEPMEMTTIKLGVPFVSTLNSALWYSEGTGIFEEYGIEIETVEIEGGRALAAMLGGSIDMTITSSNNTLGALVAGQEFTIVAATGNGFPQQVVVNSEAYAASGLADDATWQEKMEWLNGQQWGVSSPTGSSATLASYLYVLAGLDPADANLVSLGGSSGVLAGLQSGQVVVGSAGSPNPEVAVADGYAEFFIDVTGGEVPEISDITSSVLTVTPEYYEENKELMDRFREALAAGQEAFAADPETAMDFVAKEYFGTSPYDAVIQGMTNQLEGGTIATSPIVDHDSAQRMVDFMAAIGDEVPDDWERIFIDLR